MTTSDGTTITGTKTGSEPARARGGARSTCTYQVAGELLLSVPFVTYVDVRPLLLLDQPAGTDVYWKRCPGRGAETVVVPPRNPGVSGRDVAEQFVAQVPLPGTSIRFNPRSRGLVGVESWFWVEGYDGRPIGQTLDVFGLTVEVQMTLEQVDWSFGDGTTVAGDLGRPYPAESSVRHAYQRDSGDGAYPVTATFVFSARYQVNGTGWVELGRITRSASAPHRVMEAEAVRTR